MTVDYSTISSILGIGGVIFAIFLYFRNPQEKLDKNAGMLEQRVQWEKEITEKRFVEMGVRMDNALALAQNHTHTIDVKVDKLIDTIGAMNVEIGKLQTIIDERIPKK